MWDWGNRRSLWFWWWGYRRAIVERTTNVMLKQSIERSALGPLDDLLVVLELSSSILGTCLNARVPKCSFQLNDSLKIDLWKLKRTWAPNIQWSSGAWNRIWIPRICFGCLYDICQRGSNIRCSLCSGLKHKTGSNIKRGYTNKLGKSYARCQQINHGTI